jgi:hypothetical protein
MRAGLVGIVFFAAVLALGHYVAAPFFCRGGISIPSLDPRALCGADLHLNRAGSVLLYFSAISIAFFFGLIAGMLPSRKKAQDGKTDAKPAETFEQIIASEEKKKEAPAQSSVAEPNAASASAAQPSATEPSTAKPDSTEPSAAKPSVTPVAHPSALAVQSASVPEPVPTPIDSSASSSAAENAVAAALLSGKTESIAAKAEPAPAPAAATMDASTTADNIAAGLAAKKNGAAKTFDGTKEELLERFRELKKQEGVNSIAQAQRLLDESTLGALARGADPKQHLSDVAHLVLAEDPDLKSGVVRGVVVHIAARLKELGVAKSLPGAA